MFLFGLFSTHLPYIILMGLYFVGFGIYSSNAIKEKFGLKENEQSEKTIVLDVIENSESFSKDFYYSDYCIIKDIAEKQASKYSAHKRVFYCTHYFPDIKDKPASEPFYSSLFSRPPPTFSF